MHLATPWTRSSRGPDSTLKGTFPASSPGRRLTRSTTHSPSRSTHANLGTLPGPRPRHGCLGDHPVGGDGGDRRRPHRRLHAHPAHPLRGAPAQPRRQHPAAGGQRRGHPQHRLGEVDDPQVLQREQCRHRRQGQLAVHHRDHGHRAGGPQSAPRPRARRQPRGRLRRRRHDAVDLRHGGRGDALQLRPQGPERRLGHARQVPGDARDGRLRQRGPGPRLPRLRHHRPRRVPGAGDARQPHQGWLRRVQRRELLHQARHDPGLPRLPRERRPQRRPGQVQHRRVQVRHPRPHRVPGLHDRAQHRRPVLRPPGRARDEQRQAAQPDLLPAQPGRAGRAGR